MTSPKPQRASTSPPYKEEGKGPGVVRVVIENITPRVDEGEFPVKRTVGESVIVEADVFTDGHDIVAAELMYRHGPTLAWTPAPMKALGNDRFRALFTVDQPGSYFYTVKGWVNHYATWQRDVEKKRAAGQDVSVDLLREKELSPQPDPAIVLQYERIFEVTVDRERARFSSWYELFPRSVSDDANKHGTFRDVEARLPYVAGMGFDVLYLPPIHPIGESERKGPNNATTFTAGDPGSPWAIGAQGVGEGVGQSSGKGTSKSADSGGHKSIHPQLGTLDDLKHLVAAANKQGVELALDIAFQCSPDHPYVKQHPEWFRKRPDGTIQYAENPPKKYQDIYPFDFESEHWPALWDELKSVVEYWAENGIRIFRVDNPHTKPFPMWQWLIAEIKRRFPETLFLAEAFTRPKVMHRLAKIGFTQSYTYFAWRNTRSEIETYFTELTQTPIREFFRPNLWPNTPDILPEYLQFGGRPAFMARAALAATLGASYGIYGPAFELLEHEAREPGSEEYRDSEKYQIRHWDLNRPDSLREFIARLNRIRREHPALQSDWRLRFHSTDNDMLVCYSKSTEDLSDIILTVVNLDPRFAQAGWLNLDLAELGLDADTNFQVHDLLSNARFLWRGPRNYIALDPHHSPVHILLVRRRTRTEKDFDYFL